MFSMSSFFPLRWVLTNSSFPGWPGTTILLISASQVARITRVSHWLESFLFFFFPKNISLNLFSNLQSLYQMLHTPGREIRG
jgi:hypothetical protein